MVTALALQVLLTFHVEGDGPVRFGVPLPAVHVARGLHVEGPCDGAFEWSPLLGAVDADSERVWVELAIDGRGGRYRVRAGGGSTRPGAAVAVEESVDKTPARERRSRVWRWHSGAVDRLERTLVTEGPSAGVWSTVRSEGSLARRTRVRIPTRFWREVGLLPARGTKTGRDIVDALVAAVPRLPRAAEQGGRGDYVRHEGKDRKRLVVTNLEFDTTLGFVRLALATGQPGLLDRALESATHLVDRDVDVRSGLPFCHGADHRVEAPELGHCWWQGATWTALLFADRTLLDAARSIGSSVGHHVRVMEPPGHLRDVAWPLRELEAHLVLGFEPAIAQASEVLARHLLGRWDEDFGVFRFAEGESKGVAYKDRCWQTGGILLPGFRRWAERTGHADGRRIADRVESRILRMIRAGKPGLPLRYWVDPEGPRSILRRSDTPAGCLLLDGLTPAARRRVMSRRGVEQALDAMVDLDSPSLVTDWTIIARCAWVYG